MFSPVLGAVNDIVGIVSGVASLILAVPAVVKLVKARDKARAKRGHSPESKARRFFERHRWDLLLLLAALALAVLAFLILSSGGNSEMKTGAGDDVSLPLEDDVLDFAVIARSSAGTTPWAVHNGSVLESGEASSCQPIRHLLQKRHISIDSPTQLRGIHPLLRSMPR